MNHVRQSQELDKPGPQLGRRERVAFHFSIRYRNRPRDGNLGASPVWQFDQVAQTWVSRMPGHSQYFNNLIV